MPQPYPLSYSMNVFYEEDGGFKVGHLMSEAQANAQIESATGKRSKVKSSAILLRFESPSMTEFMPQAQALTAEHDVPFLWEVCGTEDFSAEALAADYIGRKPTAVEIAAVALTLHQSPMYFYKRGKGIYKGAPKENLEAALASVERKKREASQTDAWIKQLCEGILPAEMRSQMNMILYKPDRNTLIVKAAEQAALQSNKKIEQLFFEAGAWPESQNAPYEYHLGKFLADYFPKGRVPTGAFSCAIPTDLVNAKVAAFSIDDANTTEIDDAFSVTKLADGNWQIGIHIAAPALCFAPDSALEALAHDRLSTVYFPGDKITMLPESAIAAATLKEGTSCPAVSLYAVFAADTLALISNHSAIEQVTIAANLRIGELETRFTKDALESGVIAGAYGTELLLLHGIAKQLMALRGKAEDKQDRVDYNFDIKDSKVIITSRQRGNPIDTVVSEFMIFANATWGKLLADNGVAAIYRAQANMKTRMTLDAMPHEGLGVAQYAWSSSPLRRAVDLLNQRQLISHLRGETPLYPKRSPALNELARTFDLTYTAYNDFQTNLERFWCMRYLQQEHIESFEATVVRDEVMRAANLPLIFKLDKSPNLPSRTPARVQVGAINYWAIEGVFTFVESSAPMAEVAATAESTTLVSDSTLETPVVGVPQASHDPLEENRESST